MNNVQYLADTLRVKIGVAIAATALMVGGGAAWRGMAADAAASAPVAMAAQNNSTVQTPPAGRAFIGGRDSYADVVKTVTPAVVTIRTEGRARVRPTGLDGDDQEEMLRRFFGQQFDRRGQAPQRAPKQRGLGSGVIVSNDGYILTNNHVVDGAEKVLVDLSDSRTLTAKVVGTDQPSDLALLKVESTNLPTLSLGNSDTVQVGDVVLAVGNPLGLGQTVTMGIISAKGRSTGGNGTYEDFLQTDAPINHGNSGGALVNLKGELVGINSQIVSQSDGNIGIGFAIPANMANHVMSELKTGGRVRRSQLGVTIQPVTSDMAESLGLKDTHGVIVSNVADGSAAGRAGVKQGDIIRSFNGQPVQDLNSLRIRVSEVAPGSSATLTVNRDGSEKTLTVKLDESEASKSASNGAAAAQDDDKASLGVGVEALTPELAAQVGLPRTTRGVIVSEVNPEGRAADAGIQEGDVILQVNRAPVQTVEELRAAVRKSTDRPTLLLVKRDKQDIFVTVRPS